jgi:hypothetical protein
MPSCDGCWNGQGPPPAPPPPPPHGCDESTWPARAASCGECAVAVDPVAMHGYGTCDGYCGALGKTCVDASPLVPGTCEVIGRGLTPSRSCADPGRSDLCRCSPDLEDGPDHGLRTPERPGATCTIDTTVRPRPEHSPGARRRPRPALL